MQIQSNNYPKNNKDTVASLLFFYNFGNIILIKYIIGDKILMNIVIKHGNIFDSRCDLLVNPVNCVGVMGAGLALQFKIQYPEMFRFYKEVCRTRQLRPGNPIICDENVIDWNYPQAIILFPTKYDWRNTSNPEYIEIGLRVLIEIIYDRYKISNSKQSTKTKVSIAFPKIGCGLGKLDWNIVKELIVSILNETPKTDIFDIVEIYE